MTVEEKARARRDEVRNYRLQLEDRKRRLASQNQRPIWENGQDAEIRLLDVEIKLYRMLEQELQDVLT